MGDDTALVWSQSKRPKKSVPAFQLSQGTLPQIAYQSTVIEWLLFDAGEGSKSLFSVGILKSTAETQCSCDPLSCCVLIVVLSQDI